MKKYILFALFMNLTTAFSYSQVRINVQGGAVSTVSQRVPTTMVTLDSVSV